MPSVAETLHWLRDQRDRLKMEAEEKRSLKVLGHELDKLRQEIRDLGGEPCCLLEDYTEFEITPAMMEAGITAFCLFDRATLPEYVVWAVYQDMLKVAVATGVVVVKERENPPLVVQTLSE